MTSSRIRSFPLAYHLRLRAYGTWLPGDPRGWHQRGDDPHGPPRPPSPVLNAIAREAQRDPTIIFETAVVDALIASVGALSEREGWRLHALRIDASHLHAVVQAALPGVSVLEKMREHTLDDLLARGLRTPGARFWSESAYFVCVESYAHLRCAIDYVERHPSG